MDVVETMRELVEIESPSSDVDACARCADTLAAIGERLLAAPVERLSVDGRAHLRWRFGEPRVAVLGHFDTVWPLGTLAKRPFVITDGIATGPGTFDMKAGVAIALHATAALDDRDGIELLFTSDEEIASPTSRALIEDLARRVDAVLVLEPGLDDAVKTARKGISMYRVEITGKPAHAGLEPEKGVNAISALARLVPAIEAMADPPAGTSVTPTRATAGIAVNVVAPNAVLDVDVRARTIAEQERVDAAMRALQSDVNGASVAVDGGPDRPPLEAVRSQDLFERAQRIAQRLGFGVLRGVEVGGGSDGNLTAAAGAPTLDGLGAVGGGAHANDEHVVVSKLAERQALLQALLGDLLTTPSSR